MSLFRSVVQLMKFDEKFKEMNKKEFLGVYTKQLCKFAKSFQVMKLEKDLSFRRKKVSEMKIVKVSAKSFGSRPMLPCKVAGSVI